MVYREDIAKLILAEAEKEVKPLVAHITNFPHLNQKDVTDTVKQMIEDEGLKAKYHFDYKDICSITFTPTQRL